MIAKNTISILIFLITLFSGMTYGQKVCLCDLELIDSRFYKVDSIFSGNYECLNANGVKSETGFIDKGFRATKLSTYHPKLMREIMLENL